MVSALEIKIRILFLIVSALLLFFVIPMRGETGSGALSPGAFETSQFSEKAAPFCQDPCFDLPESG
ncbi:MAG TPA: hypothetical protein ENN34_01090 [Deltaproteobacteria bacterium]|nr:hypothetical protein [Deltaproteobacteria bacterium]